KRINVAAEPPDLAEGIELIGVGQLAQEYIIALERNDDLGIDVPPQLGKESSNQDVAEDDDIGLEVLGQPAAQGTHFTPLPSVRSAQHRDGQCPKLFRRHVDGAGCCPAQQP